MSFAAAPNPTAVFEQPSTVLSSQTGGLSNTVASNSIIKPVSDRSFDRFLLIRSLNFSHHPRRRNPTKSDHRMRYPPFVVDLRVVAAVVSSGEIGISRKMIMHPPPNKLNYSSNHPRRPSLLTISSPDTPVKYRLVSMLDQKWIQTTMSIKQKP